MRSIYVIVLITVLMAAACGCVASPSPSATPAVTSAPSMAISISGVVRDSAGAVVPGARVALWQGDQLVATPENVQYANETGVFVFTNLPPAHYQVTADIGGRQGLVDRRFDASASIEVVIPASAATATGTPATGSIAPGLPRFTVTRTGPTTVQVDLISFGSARSIRGFYVKSPFLTTPELMAPDKPLGESWSATITDPNLKGSVHFVASSWVNGDYAVVVDTVV